MAPLSSRASRKPSPAQAASSKLILARNGWRMLRIEGLTAGYSAIPVLNGVSIKVEQGQFVAIVGPNGAGKTTLFKTISGIVRPSVGARTFEATALLSVRPARRAHLGIAHIPEGRQVFPSLTVMENLEMGAMTEAGRRDWKVNIESIFEQITVFPALTGMKNLERGEMPEAGRRDWKVNIERIFEWLPVLAERRVQFAGTLSGGQQQMLAIGRGLASAPKLLMLDEPAMGLAPAIADFVFERLIEIRRQSNLTILLVEQHVADAPESPHHGCVLEGGRVALEGNNQTLRADDRVRKAYLGM